MNPVCTCRRWLLILPLLFWCVMACAQSLGTASEIHEYQLPQQSNEVSPDADTERQQYMRLKAQAEQRSIGSGRRLALTPELHEVKRLIDALIETPQQLAPLYTLQGQPELLRSYVETQFYNASPLQQQQTYIQLYALILGEGAAATLIEWARGFEKPALIVSVVQALTYLRPSDEIRGFIDGLLNNELQSAEVVRGALFYYAQWPHASAMRHVVHYRNRHIAPDIRYVALYLEAVLGDAGILPVIVKLLEQQPPVAQRYYLHLAVSRLLTQEQYRQLAVNLPLTAQAAESVQRQAKFRQADEQQRTLLVDAMSASYYPEERRLALDHLVASRDLLRLSKLLQGPQALEVFRRAAQAGIRLDASIQISEVPNNASTVTSSDVSSRWLWIATIGFLTIVMVVLFMKRRTGSARLHMV